MDPLHWENTSTPYRSSIKRKQVDLQDPDNIQPADSEGIDNQDIYKSRRISDLESILEDSSTFLGFSSSDVFVDSHSELHSDITDPEDTADESTLSESAKTIRYIEKSFQNIVDMRSKTEDLSAVTEPGAASSSSNNIQAELIKAFKSVEFNEALHAAVKSAIEPELQPIERKLDQNCEAILDVQARVRVLESYHRQHRLILSGLSEGETSTDELLSRFLSIAAFLDVPLASHDITEIYRIKGRSGDSSRPRLILVEFLNKKARSTLYQRRSKLKNFPGDKLYINEDLTPECSKLFHAARLRCKDAKWYGCFTRNGQVFIKVSANSKPERISSIEELNVKHPATTTTDFK